MEGESTDDGDRSGLDLYWIPLGAGARVVRLSGRVYERVAAAARRRRPVPLFHSALIATTPDGQTVVEMAPIPDDQGRAARGVVAEGPVGLRPLGRLRLFRYEVRCWPGGRIPDLPWAEASPVRISDDETTVDLVLGLVPAVPTPVWGRDELATGDMWNSNSVVSWLLATAGVQDRAGRPPRGGRAPGWDAGLAIASRR